MTRRGLTLVVASGLLVIVVVVGLLINVPYVELRPGPTYNTLGQVDGVTLIKIDGRSTYPTSGHLNLTTVSVVSSVSLPGAIAGWFETDTAVVPREVVYPPGQSVAQTQAQEAQQMQQSQQHAIVAALCAARIPFQATVSVGDVSAGTPAAAVLHRGDVITAVDGQPVTGCNLRQLIRDRPAGQQVRLTLNRGGQTQTVTARTVATGPDRTPVIGFTPLIDAHPGFKIEIQLQNVGGPSAGLMFALGIYDKLTPGDLTGGRFVAGTGEIDDSGDVIQIGGIREKIAAARSQGATVFLTPAANCAEAVQDLPAGIRLVKVSTVPDAINALAALRRGSANPPSCATSG